MPPRRRGVFALVVLAICVALPGAAQEPADPAESITLTLDLERALLAEDLLEHERVARRRSQLDDRIERQRNAMGEVLRNEERAATEIQMHLRELETAEGDRAAVVEQERQLVQRILERRRKLEILAKRLAEVDDRPPVGGPLTGTWRLTMLPTDQRGTFFLRQVGTVVTGTYLLDGNFTGSLEGTLIDRKVSLERIDSKLGRMMEFEGRLSSDGTTLRGRWLNRELAGGEGADGQWSAVRRERTR